MSGPDFYKEGGGAIREVLARRDALERELAEAYARWEALESRLAVQNDR